MQISVLEILELVLILKIYIVQDNYEYNLYSSVVFVKQIDQKRFDA